MKVQAASATAAATPKVPIVRADAEIDMVEWWSRLTVDEPINFRRHLSQGTSGHPQNG